MCNTPNALVASSMRRLVYIIYYNLRVSSESIYYHENLQIDREICYTEHV